MAKTELALTASEDGKVITAKRGKDIVAVARRDALSGNFEAFVGPEPEPVPELEEGDLLPEDFGPPPVGREYLGQAFVLSDNKTYRVQIHQQRPVLQRFGNPKDAIAFLLEQTADKLVEVELEELPGAPLVDTGTPVEPGPDATPAVVPGVEPPAPDTVVEETISKTKKSK